MYQGTMRRDWSEFCKHETRHEHSIGQTEAIDYSIDLCTDVLRFHDTISLTSWPLRLHEELEALSNHQTFARSIA